MMLNNRIAVIVLGVLVGASLTIARISSEAYLLSLVDPIYALVLATVGSIAYYSILFKLNWNKSKFSIPSATLTLVMGVTFALGTLVPGGILFAFGWSFLVALSLGFHHWICAEILGRHLNPVITHSYFAYMSMAMELGTLLSIALRKLFFSDLEPTRALLFTAVLYLITGVFILIQFVPLKNLEVRFEDFAKKDGTTSDEESTLLKAFFRLFALLAAIFGASKVTEGYLINVVIKEELGSFANMRELLESYYIAVSFGVILFSLLTGRLVEKKHVSPYRLIGIYGGLIALVATIAAVENALFVFVGLGVIRRVCEVCLYNQGIQMIVMGFAEDIKLKARALHGFSYSTAIAIPLTAVYYYASQIEGINQRVGLSVVLAIISAGGLCAVPFVKKSMVRCLNAFVSSGRRALRIPAIRVLSFLKPPEYETTMTTLLETNPKQVLRKNIIMALGYSNPNNSTIEVILKQFDTPQEEIQFAVLDSLKVTNRYRALQFISNVMMAKERSYSLKVRMNAARVIASLYGRKAIPFLLNGLEDPDHRVVANTLEVLSLFKDPTLIQYFWLHRNSEIPRVRANALMGLGVFRNQRVAFAALVRETLLPVKEAGEIASTLYVIGQLKDATFLPELRTLLASEKAEDPLVRRGLAWAFTQCDDSEGFRLFAQLFFDTSTFKKEPPFMHYISHLSSQRRFELVKYIGIRHYDDIEIQIAFVEGMERSHFNFNDEIHYFEVLLESIEDSRKSKLKMFGKSY